jgi:hypothetical protein
MAILTSPAGTKIPRKLCHCKAQARIAPVLHAEVTVDAVNIFEGGTPDNVTRHVPHIQPAAAPGSLREFPGETSHVTSPSELSSRHPGNFR